MDMPVETLDRLINVSQKASAVSPVAIASIGRGVTIVTNPDGSFEKIVRIEPRQHKLGSVSELPPFITYHKKERQADPVVFLAPNCVHVVLHDGTESVRDDKASCSLSFTDRFEKLRTLNQGTIDQKSLIRLLKVTFEGDLCENGKLLLSAVRKLARSSDQQSTRSGTVVHEVVAGNGMEFPSQITITTSVFNDSALKTRHAVKVQVEVIPENGTFELIPSDTGLTQAIDESLNEIKTLLSACECPVFLGTP